eukprot:Sro3344_g347030.2  (377) ;mRNA; r:5289-6419
MPYPCFVDFLKKVKESGFFSQYQRRNSAKTPPSPIGLLLLGSLRYLGRGHTFDDLEEATAISEETHRRFFHRFIQYGEDTLYPEYAIAPQTAEEFQTHQHEFAMAGLPGCGFSTDATNVILWNCTHNLKQSHIGFKQNHPARTYNLSTNHRKQILHTTKGHRSRWNDKTLAYYDSFLNRIHEGSILQDVTFFLLERSTENNNESVIKRTKYKGAWWIVDNGYHRWSCTQAPGKSDMYRPQQRLSEFIESMRKDVECVFGILKGRWRVLKTGIRLHGETAADRIWLTCCALHNMLLQVDGLSEQWNGEIGLNETDDLRFTPFALQRLGEEQMQQFGSRQHELESDETVRALVDGNVEEGVDDGAGGTEVDDDGANLH